MTNDVFGAHFRLRRAEREFHDAKEKVSIWEQKVPEYEGYLKRLDEYRVRGLPERVDIPGTEPLITFDRREIEERIVELRRLRRDSRARLEIAEADFKSTTAEVEANTDEVPTWVDIDTSDDAAWELVPLPGSFAEREREIANELTQLPNFTAMVRLSTGAHHVVRTTPLPEPTGERLRRIEVLRERTRTIAIPKDQRKSIREADYFSELRQTEAHEYEAELDEQPSVAPPA